MCVQAVFPLSIHPFMDTQALVGTAAVNMHGCCVSGAQTSVPAVGLLHSMTFLLLVFCVGFFFFLRNFPTVLHNGCANLHPPHIQDYLLFTPFRHLLHCFSSSYTDRGRQCLTMVLICIPLLMSDVQPFCTPVGLFYLLWRKTYSDP